MFKVIQDLEELRLAIQQLPLERYYVAHPMLHRSLLIYPYGSKAQRRGKRTMQIDRLMQKPANFEVIQVLYRDKIRCLYYWSREISCPSRTISISVPVRSMTVVSRP